jgi:hypothetical protein
MQLLDAGQAPRRRLRYAWRVDQKEQLGLDLRTAASTEIGGRKEPEIPLPPVHITIAIEPQSVSSEGDLSYGWHVTAATVNADPATSVEIAEGMREQVAPILHLSGTALVNAQGLTKDVSVDPASLGDAGAQAQMVVQVVQTLRDVAAPLPTEEVGQGARWQKLSRLDARDAHVAQTDTFTLATMRGENGTLDDALAQTASPQAIAGPSSGGPAARMESMLTSGEAKTRFSLTRLVPQMSFEGTTQMVVSGQAGQGPARMTMMMRVKIGIEGTTGAAH